MTPIQITLYSFLMINCVFVPYSTTPVESILFLILTFGTAGILLLLYNVEFLGIIFIIIYVGAIAILFLFVVMMLNIKESREEPEIFWTSTVHFVGWTVILCVIEWLNRSSALIESEESYIFDSVANTNVLGQVLFNNYLLCFLISGIILLVALLGAIVLTLELHKTKRNQTYLFQLSRQSKNAIRLVK